MMLKVVWISIWEQFEAYSLNGGDLFLTIDQTIQFQGGAGFEICCNFTWSRTEVKF